MFKYQKILVLYKYVCTYMCNIKQACMFAIMSRFFVLRRGYKEKYPIKHITKNILCTKCICTEHWKENSFKYTSTSAILLTHIVRRMYVSTYIFYISIIVKEEKKILYIFGKNENY